MRLKYRRLLPKPFLTVEKKTYEKHIRIAQLFLTVSELGIVRKEERREEHRWRFFARGREEK